MPPEYHAECLSSPVRVQCNFEAEEDIVVGEERVTGEHCVVIDAGDRRGGYQWKSRKIDFNYFCSL